MRTSAKGFVLDPAGRLLLLDCVDPADTSTRWWELPGGGVEPGEDEADAVVREVLEETGVVVPPDLVGRCQWTQVASFSWRGRRHVARHTGRLVRLRDAPAYAPVALTPAEEGTILGQRWWEPAELLSHPGRFFPSAVPTLLPRLLAGERVDEPAERWN